MPLLDHFKLPVPKRMQWGSFHSNWATRIADRLGEIMPQEFQAIESMRLGGGIEIDIGTVREGAGVNGVGSPRVSEWQPPPAASVGAVFPDRFEVLVLRDFGGTQIVAAIELISPGNKDDEEAQLAFVSKVVSYLHEGVSVLIVDVVTGRWANLHNEVVRTMKMPEELLLPPERPLYAASYRPVIREGEPRFDIWVEAVAVGEPLPTMPIRLIADYFVPVELEMTYTEACRRRRLIP